jgi:hypothetical protein
VPSGVLQTPRGLYCNQTPLQKLNSKLPGHTTRMLLTSWEVAQRLEEVDIIHITRQMEACSEIFPDHKSFTVPIGHGHGVASITLPTFGRKLNRITGYGMAGTVS